MVHSKIPERFPLLLTFLVVCGAGCQADPPQPKPGQLPGATTGRYVSVATCNLPDQYSRLPADKRKQLLQDPKWATGQPDGWSVDSQFCSPLWATFTNGVTLPCVSKADCEKRNLQIKEYLDSNKAKDNVRPNLVVQMNKLGGLLNVDVSSDGVNYGFLGFIAQRADRAYAGASVDIDCFAKLSSTLCYKPTEKDAAGCGYCDPARGTSSWTIPAGRCKIDGKCYNAGDRHPGQCAECVPSTSSTSWTVKGNSCLIDGQCRAANARDSINLGLCDPSKSKTSWTIPDGKCKINGVSYQQNDQLPGDKSCAKCLPSVSKTRWTLSGSDDCTKAGGCCVIEGACLKAGGADSTGCRSCVPSKNKYAWTVNPGRCLIDGFCQVQGSKDPSGCGYCAPALNTTSWTVARVADPKQQPCLLESGINAFFYVDRCVTTTRAKEFSYIKLTQHQKKPGYARINAIEALTFAERAQ